MANTKIIKCPVCGAEYLPGEIYYPNYFLGKPGEVLKDIYGKIDCWSGTTVDTVETYTCDVCGNTFTVEAKVDFSTKIEDKTNLKEDYKTPLYGDRIKLNEEN